ncbi:SigE family RNA polymerase sigma factor [Streptacidiphilus sp. EB103A]|uniref:SigE family RNA polymerase sigma factor n=1 Tax=Streptacidiphilus sp. EB103A TaxID=3156275 RepID=UPI003514C58F
MATHERDAEFTVYVQMRSRWLHRIAYLLCQDPYRADDLTQSTLLKLYLNWGRARRADNFDGYVRTILVNTFLREQQSTWWRRMTLQRGPDTYAAEGDMDSSLDLLSALSRIPPRQRAALVLRFYCDLSVAETASLLGCSEGNVKSQTSRGLTALRLVLGNASALKNRKEIRRVC